MMSPVGAASSSASSTTTDAARVVANAPSAGNDPPFFISDQAASDPALLLFRKYRDVLSVLDPSDLLSVARLSLDGLLRNDPVLSHYVSVFVKDPFLAEALRRLLPKFWRGGFWEEGDSEAHGGTQLPEGREYTCGGYPDVQLLRVFCAAVEAYCCQSDAHAQYFQRSALYPLLLCHGWYEIDHSHNSGGMCTAAPPHSAFFSEPNGTAGRRLYRRTEARALEQIRGLHGHDLRRARGRREHLAAHHGI